MAKKVKKELPYRHPKCQHCIDEVARIRKRAQEVGESLLGSSSTLSHELGEHEEHLEDDQDFCDALDQIAMQCNGCGLWSESVGDEDCDECAEDDEEED